MVPAVSPVKDSSSCTGLANHNLLHHLCNTYAGYVPFGPGCSPASPFKIFFAFHFMRILKWLQR